MESEAPKLPEPHVVPFQAVISVRGVVNQQQPDGLWHPAAVFNEGFTVTIDSDTEVKVVEKVKEKLQEIHKLCQTTE